MKKIFHSSSDMEPDLKSKRVEHPVSGRPMKHSVSRHCNLDGLRWQDGQVFGQGTPFPRHVNAGQITEIEKFVLNEYQNYMRGRPSQVIAVQDAGGADRIVVNLGKFGVGEVGAFIRNGSICTVFPEDE